MRWTGASCSSETRKAGSWPGCWVVPVLLLLSLYITLPSQSGLQTSCSGPLDPNCQAGLMDAYLIVSDTVRFGEFGSSILSLIRKFLPRQAVDELVIWLDRTTLLSDGADSLEEMSGRGWTESRPRIVPSDSLGALRMQLSAERAGFAAAVGGWRTESSGLDSFRARALNTILLGATENGFAEVELNPRFAHAMDLLRSPKGASGQFTEEVAGPLLHLFVEQYGNNPALLNTILDMHPSAAKHKDGTGWLPLHHAAMRHGSADDSIQTLLRAYPEAAAIRTSDGWLPLHLLCRYHGGANSSLSVLLNAWPRAVYERNGDGWLPLHLLTRYAAVHNNSVHTLLSAGPDSVRKTTTSEGWLPLHFVSHYHATAFQTMKLLLDANPQAASIKAKVKVTAGPAGSKRQHNEVRNRKRSYISYGHFPSHLDSGVQTEEHWYPLHILLRQDLSSVESLQLLIEAFPVAIQSIPREVGIRTHSSLCNQGQTLHSELQCESGKRTNSLESFCRALNDSWAGAQYQESVHGGDGCLACRTTLTAEGNLSAQHSDNVQDSGRARTRILKWVVDFLRSIAPLLQQAVALSGDCWTNLLVAVVLWLGWRWWSGSSSSPSLDSAESERQRSRRGKSSFKKKERTVRAESCSGQTASGSLTATQQCPPTKQPSSARTTPASEEGKAPPSAAPVPSKPAQDRAAGQDRLKTTLAPAADSKGKKTGSRPPALAVDKPAAQATAASVTAAGSGGLPAGAKQKGRGTGADQWTTVGAVNPVKPERRLDEVPSPTSSSSSVRGPRPADVQELSPGRPEVVGLAAAADSQAMPVMRSPTVASGEEAEWQVTTQATLTLEQAEHPRDSLDRDVIEREVLERDVHEPCALHGPNSEGSTSSSISSGGSRPMTPVSVTGAGGSTVGAGDCFGRTLVGASAAPRSPTYPRCVAGPMEPPLQAEVMATAAIASAVAKDHANVENRKGSRGGVRLGLELGGLQSVEGCARSTIAGEADEGGGAVVAVLPSGLFGSPASAGERSSTGRGPEALWGGEYEALLASLQLGAGLVDGARGPRGVGCGAGAFPKAREPEPTPPRASPSSRRFPVALRDDVPADDADSGRAL